MAEAGDFDRSRFGSMRDDVKYKINSYPTKDGANGILTKERVELAFSQAFSKWQAVSTFEFHASQENPDIVIEFGDFVEVAKKYRRPGAQQAAQDAKNRGDVLALTMTTAQSTQEINTPPIPIIFDNSRYWTVFAKESAVGVVGVVRRTIESLPFLHLANDLLTVAVHEIGHALGLGHSSDPNSIMRPTLGLWDTTLVYYMTGRPLPDVDAQALERRYRSVDLPYDPKLLGCAIVGSTFQQTDEESQTARSDVEQFCWGVRENTPTVPLMHGYCYNSALGVRGYGYWMLHLLPPGPGEHLGGREYVVGGGILRRTEPGWAVTFGGRLKSLEDTRGYAPIPDKKWGSDTGVIQLAARAYAWNPLLSGDADSMMYFVIGREENLPRLRLEGFYTVIGAASYPQEGRYGARGWGSQDMPNASASVVAEARTYAIEQEGSGRMSFYENANSQTVIRYTSS